MDQPTDIASVRVFLALWPSAPERSALTEWQPPLQRLAGGRIILGDTLHATLVFIGGINSDRLEALQLAAQEVSTESFELCLAHAHYWGHNHIVYAAPSHMPLQLADLVGKLEAGLIRHGFQFELRAYKPHITLLRHALWTDQPLPQMQPVLWHIRDFALVQSHPGHGTASYQVLARFPLLASEA